MENIIDREVTQLQYMEVKQELWGKAKILGLCTLAFFLVFKLLNNDTSVFSCLKDGFYFALVMYLPFKICYQTTGSVISSFIGSFIIVIIVGLVLGDSSTLLGFILFGGMAVDFGWSIYKMWNLRKLLTGTMQ